MRLCKTSSVWRHSLVQYRRKCIEHIMNKDLQAIFWATHSATLQNKFCLETVLCSTAEKYRTHYEQGFAIHILGHPQCDSAKQIPFGDTLVQYRRKYRTHYEQGFIIHMLGHPQCDSAKQVPFGGTLLCSTAEKASTWCVICCEVANEMLTCFFFPRYILFERDPAVSDVGAHLRVQTSTWT